MPREQQQNEGNNSMAINMPREQQLSQCRGNDQLVKEQDIDFDLIRMQLHPDQTPVRYIKTMATTH